MLQFVCEQNLVLCDKDRDMFGRLKTTLSLPIPMEVSCLDVNTPQHWEGKYLLLLEHSVNVGSTWLCIAYSC